MMMILAAAEAAAATTGRDFSILGLIRHADPVVQGIMLLLVLASVVCWGIMIEKAARLRRLKREVSTIEAVAATPNGRLVGDGGLIGALAHAAMIEAGEGSVPGETRGDIRQRLDTAMRTALRMELKRLENGLPFLATVGSASPFIGLLGTVWGIMHSFTSIAQAKDTSLAVVAPGIAEALFATAIGLAAAIPAVIGYNQIAVALGRYGERVSAAISGLAKHQSQAGAKPAKAA
jgi:biopolymer transport protein ExbB/TolQ